MIVEWLAVAIQAATGARPFVILDGQLREQQCAEAALRAQQQWQAASEAQVHHALFAAEGYTPFRHTLVWLLFAGDY